MLVRKFIIVRKTIQTCGKSILDSFGFNTFTRKDARRVLSSVDILSLDV